MIRKTRPTFCCEKPAHIEKPELARRLPVYLKTEHLTAYLAFLLARYFAHRAFWAAAILRRAEALIMRLPVPPDAEFERDDFPPKFSNNARARVRSAISLSNC